MGKAIFRFQNPYVEYKRLNECDIPDFQRETEMILYGYDKSKIAAKYRCPLMKMLIVSCPFINPFSKTDYCMVVKNRNKTNLKLFSLLMY